jgi:hypothetical protein
LRAAAVAWFPNALTDPIEVRFEFGNGVVLVPLRNLLPGAPEVRVLMPEERCDEVVLGTEMAVEARLGDASLLDNQRGYASERRAVSGHDVAVFGATGHTGRFVVAELMRRGITPVAVARDRAKLAASELANRGGQTRAASIDDPGSLDRAFGDVAAVINCAGPFLDTADAVAAAALRAGAHYLDILAFRRPRGTMDNA